MLTYSPWKIEQKAFVLERELELQRQLALTNGYLSQGAFVEEYFSQPQENSTYLRGIAQALPTLSTVSIRLHENRLDLATWQVQEFYRCLHRDEPLLERSMLVCSPIGQTLRVRAQRRLSASNPHLIEVEFEVCSLDYEGPISFLSLISSQTPDEDWYPVDSQVDRDRAMMWLQARTSSAQVAYAMRFSLWKNGQIIDQSPIRIEKREILGYSLTEHIQPGDVFVMKKRVSVTDSINYPSANLTADALMQLGLN